MNLKLITLKTNHTLMGEVKEENASFVSIKKPVQVVMQPTERGSSVAFVPFVEYSEEFNTGIKISINDILMVNTPVVELTNHYNQVFGSGIEIASTIPSTR